MLWYRAPWSTGLKVSRKLQKESNHWRLTKCLLEHAGLDVIFETMHLINITWINNSDPQQCSIALNYPEFFWIFNKSCPLNITQKHKTICLKYNHMLTILRWQKWNEIGNIHIIKEKFTLAILYFVFVYIDVFVTQLHVS